MCASSALLVINEKIMNIKPLGDRVLVKPLKAEETTKFGILLPETVDKTRKEMGEVISIGDGEKVQKLNLKVGDKVLFGKYSGEEVEIDKVDHKFLKEEEVLGIVQ
jgi:chaperonin GroES